MSRLGIGIDSAVTDDIETKRAVMFVTFVKMEFDSGTLYLHDQLGLIEWDDPDTGTQNWTGLGDFGGIDTLEDSQELAAYSVTLYLSGIDATIQTAVLSETYQGRPITVYLGAVDLTTHQLLAPPDEIWTGTMDVARMTLGAQESNAVEMVCESDLVKLDQTNGRTYSDADQQAEHSGDLIFQYATAMQGATVVWGEGGSRSIENSPGNSPGVPFGPFDYQDIR